MFVFFNTVVRTTGEAASTAAEKFSFSSLSQEMSLRGNTMSDAHSHNIFLEDKTKDGVTLLVSSERATGPPQSSSSAMFPLYHWFRPRKCWIPLPGNSSIIFKIINRTHSVPSQSTTQTRQQQRRGTKSSHIVSWKTTRWCVVTPYLLDLKFVLLYRFIIINHQVIKAVCSRLVESRMWLWAKVSPAAFFLLHAMGSLIEFATQRPRYGKCNNGGRTQQTKQVLQGSVMWH